jgi:hypothetical protein
MRVPVMVGPGAVQGSELRKEMENGLTEGGATRNGLS